MPSSISNSDPASLSCDVPQGAWGRPLILSLLLFALFVSVMEARLYLRGFVPTMEDTAVLWAMHRQRASDLGAQALILIGGSRIQLAADLNVLRQTTGLEPVQLAIDGSNFLPVLEDLASDPSVQGTVLVDYADHHLLGVHSGDPAYEYIREYRHQLAERGYFRLTFAATEQWLGDHLHARLRSYADGAKSLTSFWSRLIRRKPVPQYLVMDRDRARRADYSQVQMPEFYYRRVMRNLNAQVPVTARMSHEDMQRELQQRVAEVAPMDGSMEQYLSGVRRVADLAARIGEHGGAVKFMVMPSSGLVRMIEEKRFPRDRFWDRFSAQVSTPTLHFADVPALRDFTCPDGSHLDVRDRARFSTALARALGLAKNSDAAGVDR